MQKVLIGLYSILLYISVIHITDIYTDMDSTWYRGEVRFSDWREVKPVHFATNVPPAWYYSKYQPEYLRDEQKGDFYNRLFSGDTLLLAVDYLINYHYSRQYFYNDFTFWKVGGQYYPIAAFFNHHATELLFNQKVITLIAYSKENKIIMEIVNNI